MQLSDLLARPVTPDPVITGLANDSRKVKPGSLFAALSGSAHDGKVYIQQALEAGAAAILADDPLLQLPAGVTLVVDAQPRKLLGEIAARFFKKQPQTIVAVTGTNGKTSTAVFSQQIYAALGHRAVSVGTLGVHGAIDIQSGMTTPDTISLHAMLSEMVAQKITHVAMEASSHGLEQYRMHAVNIKAAGFTNLSRDHLDYHGSIEAYFASKVKLFTEVMMPDGTAVLNADCDHGKALIDICKKRGLNVITYGRAGQNIVLEHRHAHPTGQTLRLIIDGAQHLLKLPLVGAFQAANAMCALGLALATEGKDALPKALDALSKIEGAPGRLQFVDGHPNRAAVYVDYAHTPDAIATLLQALRPHTEGRLSIVFGCGGDRDAGKRPLMGEMAQRFADDIIVTDDNPRSEDPATIRKQVLAGCPGASEIGDRREAIKAALAKAGRGDVVVIAGKGHEQGQTIKGETLHFNDVEEVQSAFKGISVDE
jgi:UDP-N-acetylmuramoyl-L-alanyl-D-glutamate--2,6-diaminopimelate ligase